MLEVRLFYWDEVLREVVTVDNTQTPVEDMPRTGLGYVNWLIDGDSDTSRLQSNDSFLCLIYPDRNEWTLSDADGVAERIKKSVDFIEFKGMQFSDPSWDKVRRQALRDPDFPSKNQMDKETEEVRNEFNTAVQFEKHDLRLATAAMETERDALAAERAALAENSEP